MYLMSVSYLKLKIIAELCGCILAPGADVGLSEDHFVPKDSILVVLLFIEELLEAVGVVVVFGRGHPVTSQLHRESMYAFDFI